MKNNFTLYRTETKTGSTALIGHAETRRQLHVLRINNGLKSDGRVRVGDALATLTAYDNRSGHPEVLNVV